VNPNYAYNFHDGRIYAGMTRVVWELNEVIENHGGTCFIPGSHKANYAIRKGHPSIDARDSGLWQSYGCPPGSLVIFSEAVRHSADAWRHPTLPRLALFLRQKCSRASRPSTSASSARSTIRSSTAGRGRRSARCRRRATVDTDAPMLYHRAARGYGGSSFSNLKLRASASRGHSS
jgi:hypothetical protein